jgi:hypothetical protein
MELYANYLAFPSGEFFQLFWVAPSKSLTNTLTAVILALLLPNGAHAFRYQGLMFCGKYGARPIAHWLGCRHLPGFNSALLRVS